MTKLSNLFKENNVNWRILLGVLLLLIALPLVLKGPFERNMAILILMWACLGSAWNIFGGYTGQVSLGNAIFFGVGAYGTVIPYVKWHITPWLGVFIGIGIAIIVALFLAWPIFKLSAQYFAIATVALGETFRIIAVNFGFIGGAAGVDFLDRKTPSIYSLQFLSKLPYYYGFLALMVGVVLVMLYINRSKLGYYFRAIKSNEVSAASSGIDTRKYKTIAFVISAVITAICGAMYAQYQLYIDPNTVFLGVISTRMIMMAVIGGLGTWYGPILGAVLLVPLSEYTRANFASVIPGSDQVLYGALILAIILLQPKGIAQIITDLMHKVIGKRDGGDANEPTTS